ncbi:MAG: protein kinase, partial [Vicinamibacterales bacterium]
PEQAKGRPADKRSDVWAFGAVLYEMLTGARAFTGDDMVDVLGAVARLDPDWTKLPATTPASIRLLVQQCLTKDRKTRLGDIAGALFILRGHRALATSPSDESIAARHPRGGRRVLLWATAAAVVGVLAGLAAAAMGGLPRSEPPVAPLVAFEVDAPVSDEGGNGPYLFAVSPDGRSLVARVRPPGAEPSDAARDLLWVRPIDRVEGTFLQGTEGATWPCWSPDGRSLAFFVGGELRMMDAGGGPQQVLAGAANGANIGRGCTWNAQGTIVFVGDPAVGPFRVPASGGSATPLALVGKPRGVLSYRYPVFLPDGEHILFHLESASADESGIYVVSIDSGEIRRIGPSSIGPRFSPPDLLLFGQDGVLMAQRFDTGRLGLVGTPVRVAGDLDTAPEQAAAGVSVSANGVLAYRPGRSGVNRVLAWIDRLGQRSGLVGPAAAYVNPRLSPDDSRLAVAREDAGADIWIVDLARATSTRLTFDAATEDTPVWSPDGQRIAFVSNRRGGVFDIYVKNANGTGDEELLFASADHKMVNDWSADGRYLVFEAQNAATKTDLWALPLAGERRAMKLLGTPFTEQAGALSPDGRWLAYMSDELGSPQVFVQAFPASGGKWQVSNTPRAAKPIWGADSKALFYDAGGRLMQVDVSATKPVAELTWGRSSSLFAGLLPLFPHNFDVTRDGSRFLVLSRDRPDRVEPIVVMLNWQAGVASQGRSGSDP